MAITNLDNPSNYSPVHDDLWHVAESDNKDAVDFKYVFDLYIGNRQLLRAKIYPNPETGLGYFNASNVISNEMIFDWFTPDQKVVMRSLNDSGEYALNYNIRMGEDVSGITTLNMESGTVAVLNSCAPLFRRRVRNRFEPGTSNKYITNRVKSAKTMYGEAFYVGMMGINNAYNLQVKTYNSSGTLLTTNTISITYSTLGVYQLDISPDALSISIGTDVFSACSYYEVNIRNTSNSTTADTFRLYMTCAPKYDVVNLHFMNNMGVFDTARFGCVSRLTMDAQRKTFQKPDYRLGNYVTWWEDEINPTTFNTSRKYYETKVNFGSQYQWSYHLTMDFPTDEDYEWLAELIQSPIVYAEFTIDNVKEYYPVSIKATNYEYSKHINNRLRAFEIDIDMNLKRNGFRR